MWKRGLGVLEVIDSGFGSGLHIAPDSSRLLHSLMDEEGIAHCVQERKLESTRTRVYSHAVNVNLMRQRPRDVAI